MPFTPFHMGPGLRVKGLARRRFSLVVFGVSQVAMDVEPLVRILRRDEVVHGLTHTFAGATLLGIAAAVIGRPVAALLLGAQAGRPTWPVAFASALVGTISHVALDGLMHRDMRPLVPWSDRNPLLGLVPVGDLHAACVLSGVLGAAVLLGAWLLGRDARERASG